MSGANRCDECGRFKPWGELRVEVWDEMVDEYGHVEEKGVTICTACEAKKKAA